MNSAAFIGLRAEHCHVTKMFVSELHDDANDDILAELKALRRDVNALNDKLKMLSLKDLSDVSADNASEGDVLMWDVAESKWVCCEVGKPDTEA